MKTSRLLSRFAVLAAVHLAGAVPAHAAAPNGEGTPNLPAAALQPQQSAVPMHVTMAHTVGQVQSYAPGGHVIRWGNGRIKVDGQWKVFSRQVVEYDGPVKSVEEIFFNANGKPVKRRRLTIY